MRRNGVVGVTGEEPEKAVPKPTMSTHCGDSVVSRRWPSAVSMSGPGKRVAYTEADHAAQRMRRIRGAHVDPNGSGPGPAGGDFVTRLEVERRGFGGVERGLGRDTRDAATRVAPEVGAAGGYPGAHVYPSGRLAAPEAAGGIARRQYDRERGADRRRRGRGRGVGSGGDERQVAEATTRDRAPCCGVRHVQYGGDRV